MPGRALHSCPCQDGLSFFEVIITWWFLEEFLFKRKERCCAKDHPKTLKQMDHTKNPQSIHHLNSDFFGRHEVTKTSFKCFTMKNVVFTPLKKLFFLIKMNEPSSPAHCLNQKFMTCFITDKPSPVPPPAPEQKGSQHFP